jgi:hypothetical protein
LIKILLSKHVIDYKMALSSLAKLLTLNPEGLGPYDLLGKASTLIAEQQTVLYNNKPCVTRSKGMSKGKGENENLKNIIEVLLSKEKAANGKKMADKLFKDPFFLEPHSVKEWDIYIKSMDIVPLKPLADIGNKTVNFFKDLTTKTVRNAKEGGRKRKAVVTRRRR